MIPTLGQATAFSMCGVSLGCIGFVVLAKLSPWPVAQAVVFAVIVYGQNIRRVLVLIN